MDFNKKNRGSNQHSVRKFILNEEFKLGILVEIFNTDYFIKRIRFCRKGI